MKFKGFEEEHLANIFIRAVKNVTELVNLPGEKVIRLNRIEIQLQEGEKFNSCWCYGVHNIYPHHRNDTLYNVTSLQSCVFISQLQLSTSLSQTKLNLLQHVFFSGVEEFLLTAPCHKLKKQQLLYPLKTGQVTLYCTKSDLKKIGKVALQHNKQTEHGHLITDNSWDRY